MKSLGKILAAMAAIVLIAPLTRAQDVNDKIIVSFELHRVPIRDAIKLLFDNVKSHYSVSPDVEGEATILLKNQRFETVLEHLLRQVDATYRLEAGIYSIVRKGQGDGHNRMIASFDVDQVSVREALKALFKGTNLNYAIDPEVMGDVTIHMKNVSFEMVLQNILRQVDAYYRLEGGVYDIRHKERYQPLSRIIRKARVFDSVPVEEAVASFIQNFKAGYTLDPRVKGLVTADLTDKGAEEGLKELVKGVGAIVVNTGGAHFLILPKDAKELKGGDSAEGGPKLWGDDQFLYVLNGNVLLKLDKKDLKVVSRIVLDPPQP